MTYCFDIDDTILFSDFDGESYYLRTANRKLVDKINRLYDNENEIIIYTGRHWKHLLLTIKQLKEISLKYHTLILGKPVADFYVDDKAMTPKEFLNVN